MSKSITFSRRTVALVVALLVALTMAVGLLATQLIRSPQQVVADAAAPPPSIITAPVEFRRLSNDLVMRGNVEPASSVTVKTGGRAGEGGIAIITDVRVEAGSPVKAGQVLLEVSGRPVIALPGSVPAYRDLRPGSRGKDVTQLQKALAIAGHTTAVTGTFDDNTSAALAALYQAIGYDPPVSGEPAGTPGAVTLPMAEVAWVPELPARVRDVSARVGRESSESSVILASGPLGVNALLQPIFAAQVQPGQQAQLYNEALDQTIPGVVARVGAAEPEAPGREDAGEAPAQAAPTAQITPSKTIPETWDQADIRVTITTASTSEEALVVPATALFTTQDGRTRVQVVDAEGNRRDVEVRTGLQGSGFVEVHPVEDGALQKDDAVIVGYRQAPAQSAAVPSDEPS